MNLLLYLMSCAFDYKGYQNDADQDGLTADKDCDDDDQNILGPSSSGYYIDADGDGFGDATATMRILCEGRTAGYVQNNKDCDDTNPAINPDAPEICDGIDNNCDKLVDDADPSVTGQTTWYADSDGDGFGDATNTLQACAAPAGYVADNTDCDDTNADINPAAQEVCDENYTDEDCDGTADNQDDSVSGQELWYLDGDGDGYGTDLATTLTCVPPEPESSSRIGGDCNDNTSQGGAAINPDATEICDGIDNNCDGLIDDTGNETTWYADADGDGFGDATNTLQACAAPAGYVANADDCDDTNADINPNATETPYDSIDQNCDGADLTDVDGDGFDSVNVGGTDCDDDDAAIHPGAAETDGDGIDADCDGWDDNAITAYADNDGDGYGDTSTAVSIPADQAASLGYVTIDGDSDDNNAAVNPGAIEICDGIDNDSDGLTDDADTSVTGKTTWYYDRDLDSYGDALILAEACTVPPGHVSNASDCNDRNVAINPAATEVCDTSNTDENCNGLADDADSTTSASSKSTWYTDNDSDGYGNLSSPVSQCEQPTSGTVVDATDCDDADANINPIVTEVCDTSNLIDEDCDSLIDDADPSVDTSTQTTWYPDADGNGLGIAGATVLACAQPSGYAATGPSAWWKFNEGSGTTATDSSGNGNDGTLSTGATWTPGVNGTGSALQLDGVSGEVVVPDSADLEPGTGDFSVEGWVKFLSISSGDLAPLFYKGTGGPYNCTNKHWRFGILGDGTTAPLEYVACDYNTTNSITSRSTTSITAGLWTHIAMVHELANLDSVTIYINGHQATASYATHQDLTEVSFNTPLHMGSSAQDYFFNGLIDEPSMYSWALNPDEVYARCQQNDPTAGSGTPICTP